MSLDVEDQLKVSYEEDVGDTLAGLDGGVVASLESLCICTEDAINTENGQGSL